MGFRTATPPEEYASDEEVVAAIGALSKADTQRLSDVGAYRARALAARGLGMSAEDLLQEAIVRTLNGDRRWRKTVKFVTHLAKTISSIASHAREELKDGVVVSATSDDDEGRLGGIPIIATAADPERSAAASEQLEKVRKKFADDTEVELVLVDLDKEMTGPDIQADLGLTQTQYETIMTRLRRGVDRREGWKP